jgi:hypothetical protein
MCCDRGFLPFAAFLAAQIARGGGDFDICICSDEPLALPPELGLPVRMVDLGTDADYLALDGEGELPRSTYLRLWAIERLAAEYERLLYLDADIFLDGEGVAPLIGLDLHGRPLGAVRDSLQWRRPWAVAAEFAALGWGWNPYFNAGVLLVDGAAWRARRVLAAALDFARTHPGAMPQRDQSQLNALFRGEWAELHPAWNWQWAATRPLWSALVDVRLAHFGGTRKPWRDPEGWLPPRYRSAYAAFFETHFPQAPLSPLPARPRLGRRADLAVMQLKVLRDLGHVHRLLGRFRDPMQVLLP